LLQFNKHIEKKYDDVFGRSNGNTAVESFSTRDEALNWRKKKIAEKENKDYEVVKVSDFSIDCDD
jgi:predicted DNA-binding WGR domain protein